MIKFIGQLKTINFRIGKRLNALCVTIPVFLLTAILVGCATIPQTTGERRTSEAITGKIVWSESLEAAVKSASTQNKPMMLVFYGVSSKRLDERVFSAPDVIELARNFVCLKLGADQGDLAGRCHRLRPSR